MRIRLLLLSVVVTFAVWALMPVSSPGQTSKQQQLSELQQRIDKARRKIGRKRGTERVLSTRVGYTRTKAGKAAALKGVRGQRARLESNLDELEAASRRVTRQLQAAQRRNNQSPPGAGAIKRGGGRLVFPVDGSITSPFGPRWGRLHAGIDIPAPESTPIRAADGGTVVLLQGVGASGGYGNYTCVQHTASMSTCYAHQSRLGTSLRANVSQGQVIGCVGNTGHSFGAHLHFEVRVNGAPVDPMGYL